MSLDAVVTWAKSAVGNPTEYDVIWSQNGKALPVVKVPQTAAQDASGYSSDFASATGVTPNPGDEIGVTVQANDVPNNLLSPIGVSTPADITEPSPPVAPSVPQNIVLTQTGSL